MTHPEIIHDETPVRLFKSDFLEFFTHISPITVIVIWLPLAIYFTWSAIAGLQGQSGWFIPVGDIDRSIPLDTLGIFAASLSFSFQTPYTPAGTISISFPWSASCPTAGKIPLGDADRIEHPAGCSILFCFCVYHRESACQSRLGGTTVHRIFGRLPDL